MTGKPQETTEALAAPTPAGRGGGQKSKANRAETALPTFFLRVHI